MHCGVSGGNNNDSELQVVLEFPAEFYEHGTVKGETGCLFVSVAAEVKSQTGSYVTGGRAR